MVAPRAPASWAVGGGVRVRRGARANDARTGRVGTKNTGGWTGWIEGVDGDDSRGETCDGDVGVGETAADDYGEVDVGHRHSARIASAVRRLSTVKVLVITSVALIVGIVTV